MYFLLLKKLMIIEKKTITALKNIKNEIRFINALQKQTNYILTVSFIWKIHNLKKI